MSPSTKTCPYCAEEIAAAAIKCKHCGSFLDGRATDGRGSGDGTVHDYPPPVLTVPIIVSAVWNLTTAGGWVLVGLSFLPCIGLFIAVPYILLAVYEISTFQRAAEMTPLELHERCGVLAVLQILLGLTNALLPVVCGVLLLVYRDRLLSYESSDGSFEEPPPA